MILHKKLVKISERLVICMKRIGAIILCAMMLLGLVACGTDSENTNKGENQENKGPVTLQWCATYLDPDVVHKYVDEFNAMHERITVEVVDATYGSVSDYTAALALNIATGDDSYDIFSMSAADFNKYVTSGVAYCLDDELIGREEIKESALNVVMCNGHVYAYPATNDVVGLYVNLDMLEGSGHTLDELKTWDGMIAVGADISKQYNNYGVLTDLGFGGAYAEFLWYSSLWSNGGDISMDEEGNVTVTQPKALAAAAIQWRDLIRGEAGSTEFNNNIDYFVNGLCGMCLTGQTALSEMDEFMKGGYSFEWTFIPVPAAKEGAQSYSALGGWFTLVNSRNENPEDAVEFLNWLYFESDYVADMCKAYYQVTPLTTDEEKLQQLHEETYFKMVDEMISSGQIACKPEIALNSKVLERLGKMISNIVYQSTTNAEALAFVEDFIEEVNATVIE